jgi:hypothetical protein
MFPGVEEDLQLCRCTFCDRQGHRGPFPTYHERTTIVSSMGVVVDIIQKCPASAKAAETDGLEWLTVGVVPVAGLEPVSSVKDGGS